MASNNGAATGKWEVVKKGKKNGSSAKNQNDKKNGSAGRKALGESNVLSRPPLKMSETLFENFEKMGKKQNKEQVPPATEPQSKKQSSNKQSKKSQSSNTSTPATHRNLEEAFKSLDIADLKQQLARSQTLFPDFFDYCVYTMLRELDRNSGEPLHGYRVCIQALLQDKPRIATQNLPEYLELLRSVQNRPAKCLTIMWALGQAGFYDLSQGLRVWLGIMLPVLGVRSLSAYAIAYLDRLLLLHANLTKGFGIMGPKEFFPLLDFAFMPKNALSPSLQEQLRHLYPRLKVLAFGAKPESTLHTYLPSFLSRATSNCPADMKKELLNSMTECLCVDAQSLGVWRQLYTKHLPQSSFLLKHLLKSWKSLPPKLRKNLEETIQSFRVTNEEMRESVESRELRECHNLCQNLQVKMRGRGFPWSRLLMVLCVFVAGFIAHDIRSHGSFTDSTSARFLSSSGIKAGFLQAQSAVTVYSKQGFSWIEKNTPYYYSECARVVGPLLEQGVEKTKAAAVCISEKSVHFIHWVKETTPLVIDWVNTNTPDSVFQVLAYLKELLLLLHRNYILPALAYISELLQRAWTSLQDSCNFLRFRNTGRQGKRETARQGETLGQGHMERARDRDRERHWDRKTDRDTWREQERKMQR
uniref:Transmembrane protein 214 n=1 Tax=Cynoglossus semilaevis TaxID=244447 RepID=A0A3P8UTA0_CYNSE